MKQPITPDNTRIDTLSGDFIIVQPENGQRYTTDDMLVAWLAVKAVQDTPPGTFLDLGSGLCSVPMIILWAFPSAGGIGIEINPERLFLGRRSLKANDLLSRFWLINGDIRTTRLKRRFSLATSSPPYYEKHEGVISPHRDRAGVRFELNGSIEDYFTAAANHLDEGGIFTTVYPYRHAGRVFRAAEKNGFSRDLRIDVVPRVSKPPLISLFAFKKGRGGRNSTETLPVRNRNQSFSEKYRIVRKEIGFPEPR